MLRRQPAALTADAIGIDLDGTLIDTAPDLAEAVNAMLVDCGLEPLPDAQVRPMIGDGVRALMRRGLAARLGRPARPDEFVVAEPAFLAAYRAGLFRRSTIYPGVEAALTRWQCQGKPIACITNKTETLARPLLEQAGLARWFDVLFCAASRADRKPAPVLVERCIRRFGVAPDRLIMIGDSDHDVTAATQAGATAVAVTYGYGNPADIAAARPALTIDCLEQLMIR